MTFQTRIPAIAIMTAIIVAQPLSVRAAEAPYEAKLVRLSEILGSVHFLRNLCGEQGTTWRDAMAKIIETEKPDEERKAKLTAAFNHGFRSYDTVYTRCTAQAGEAINRFMSEGEKIADEIVSRYGN